MRNDVFSCHSDFCCFPRNLHDADDERDSDQMDSSGGLALPPVYVKGRRLEFRGFIVGDILDRKRSLPWLE